MGRNTPCNLNPVSPCSTHFAISLISPAPSGCAIVQNAAPALCLMDNKPVYACSVLAIEAQGKAITTIESLMQGENLDPIQQAFVDNDASQCGFCTPGFVVAFKAVLDKHPNASPEEIRHGLSGNVCRCGTYHGIHLAIAQMAQKGA